MFSVAPVAPRLWWHDIYMWHCTEHPVLWVYCGCNALVLQPFLGNFIWVRFRGIILFADITSLNGTVMSYVTSQHHTCIGHMTFYYKRSTNASVGGSCLLFVHLSGSTLSPEPACGWCLTGVGCNGSSTSLGWSLLSSTVIIVLALVNSAVSPEGTSSISTRPRSAALLPVSTASTGLLCLLVGAHVHRVRSDTEKYRMWPPHAHHFQCMTILGIPGWAPSEAM